MKFIIKLLSFSIRVLNYIIYLINTPKIERSNSPQLDKPSISLIEKFELMRTEIVHITNHFCCNPSLAIYNGNIISIIRGVNYDTNIVRMFIGSGESKTYDTQNYFADLTDDLIIQNTKLIEDRHIRVNEELIDGIEDIRIFIWNNKIYGLGSGHNTKYNKNTMVLIELQNMIMINHKIIDSPFLRNREKNWSPIVINDELYIIYQFYPSVIIYKYLDGKLEFLNELPSNEKLIHCSGGSAPIEYKNGYLTILHRRGFCDNHRFYEHIFVFINQDFEIKQISKPFYFEEFGIEFCIGLLLKDHHFYLSYGVKDNKAVFIKFPEHNLEQLFSD